MNHAVAAILATGAVFACAPSAQARHICRGAAHAVGNALFHVDFEFADDGKPIGRHASWVPPGTGALPGPLLVIDYALPADTLGAPLAISAVMGGRAVTTPTEFVLRGPDGVEHHEAFGGGLVGFAHRGHNDALVAAIDLAPSIDLSVRGVGGEVVASRMFDLTDKAARTALFAQALAQATEGAKAPLACGAVPN